VVSSSEEVLPTPLALEKPLTAIIVNGEIGRRWETRTRCAWAFGGFGGFGGSQQLLIYGEFSGDGGA
jgi:hypothetical protein